MKCAAAASVCILFFWFLYSPSTSSSLNNIPNYKNGNERAYIEYTIFSNADYL